MSRGEHFERVKDVMVKRFGLEEEQVTRAAHLVDDLELDSLDWVELIVVLERETGQEISENELKAVHTVEDILDLIDRKQATSA
jgi:acyl carrier protein